MNPEKNQTLILENQRQKLKMHLKILLFLDFSFFLKTHRIFKFLCPMFGMKLNPFLKDFKDTSAYTMKADLPGHKYT